MTPNELSKVKKHLPYKYGKVIAAKLADKRITAIVVVRVFNGLITNPDIVSPVIDAAIAVKKETANLKRKLKSLKAA